MLIRNLTNPKKDPYYTLGMTIWMNLITGFRSTDWTSAYKNAESCIKQNKLYISDGVRAHKTKRMHQICWTKEFLDMYKLRKPSWNDMKIRNQVICAL